MQVDPGSLVTAMLQPAFYDHPVERVELIETHISWVFLAGEFAYKVKKPCDLGFLDFSSLAKRRYFTAEELRLNRRFAPELYLGIIRIGRCGTEWVLGAEPTLEYAVKMKRFPQARQLDRMLMAGELRPGHLSAFAERISKIHGQVPVLPASEAFDCHQAVCAPVMQNFEQLRPLIDDRHSAALLEHVEQWSRSACDSLQPIIHDRHQHGFVRECHGDMHLANMVWLDNAPVLFDCIEFSDSLRRIDVINDIAFLLMDLDDRSVPELGWTFLNHYLRNTGDYAGVELLRFYKVYRAMVRAKVHYLRLAQAAEQTPGSKQIKKLAQSYIELAVDYLTPDVPRLLITHGLSGSGKTTFVESFASRFGAISIHSDNERRRLHGLDRSIRSKSPVGGGLYSPGSSQSTYRRLHDLARQLLLADYNVIVDATFLKQENRQMMGRMAEECGMAWFILDFPVEPAELRRRIEKRRFDPASVSEATLPVLEHQIGSAESFSRAEMDHVIPVLATTTPTAIMAEITGGESKEAGRDLRSGN